MISFILSFIYFAALFFLVLTLVVLPHELGHFLFALRARIKPLELALGFPGPKLFSFNKWKTKFSIYLIPLGGFIRIAGLNPEDEKEDEGYEPDESYANKTPAQKALTIFGGPFMNIVFAFLLLTFVFAVFGTPVGVSNEVGAVSKGSEAERVGLKPGDKIVQIGTAPVEDMSKAIEVIHKSPGEALYLIVDRRGERFVIVATPKLDPRLKVGMIGFSPKQLYQRQSLLGAIAYGAKETFGMAALVFYSFWMLLTGAASVRDLAGPVGIAQFSGQAAAAGLVAFLGFTAFLSVNLGIVNLLPIPALDGGRLVFILIEAIRRKPLSQDAENRVHAVGLAIFIALAVVITINDVARWIAVRQ